MTAYQNVFREVIKTSRLACLVKMLIGCICCCGLVTSSYLVNAHDATWNGAYYSAGNWELSIGRWAVRYLDKLHFSEAIQPFNGIITIFLFVVGTEILAWVFQCQGMTLVNIITSALILSNVAMPVYLSYSYTATMYGHAFLFSMVVLLLMKKTQSGWWNIGTIPYIIICSVLVTVIMGLYQSFLGCILCGAVSYFLFCILRGERVKKLLSYASGFCVMLLLGLFLYEAVLHASLRLYDTSLASYNGMNRINAKQILLQSGASVIKAVRTVRNYYSGITFHVNMFYSKRLLIIAIILLGLWMIVVGILSKICFTRWIFLILCTVCMPVTTVFTMVLAPESGFQIQQSFPVAMLIPFLLLSFRPPGNFMTRTAGRISLIGGIFAMSLLIWGNLFASLTDQEAMREGIIARDSLAEMIFAQLVATDCLPEEGETIAIIGNPEESSLFHATEIYYLANMYARTGSIRWQSDLDNRSWNGIFYYDLGIHLSFPKGENYKRILASDEVREMPCFPEQGSITRMEDMVVVKVS